MRLIARTALQVSLMAATLASLWASHAGAMTFPHLDYSAHLERGRPGAESFGTLLPEPTEEPARDEPLGDTVRTAGTPGMAHLVEAYDEALAQRRFAAAVEFAEALVARVAEDVGTDHVQYGHVQSDLGAALHHVGRSDEAIPLLRASLERIGLDEGIFSASLVGVHAYLGAALQATGAHGDALDEFSRAQALTHRHEGANNLRQVKLLVAKANSLDALGETWEAEQVLRGALRISEQQLGPLADETLPVRWFLAEWLTARGEYEDALTLYGDARRALEASGDDGSPQLVATLRGMAATYLLAQDVDVDRGLSLSRRVADVIEAQPDRFDLAQRVDAQLQLGDWLTLFDREEEAWAAYARAWSLAQEDPKQRWAGHFEEPRLIYGGPNLTVDFMGYQVIGREVFHDFEFRVRPDGRPSHVRVLDSNLSTLTRRRAIGFLRLARFRPALTGGEPASTGGFRFRRYYPTHAPDDYEAVIVNGAAGHTPMTNFERRWPGRR